MGITNDGADMDTLETEADLLDEYEVGWGGRGDPVGVTFVVAGNGTGATADFRVDDEGTDEVGGGL